MKPAYQWMSVLAVCGLGLAAAWQVHSRAILPLKAQRAEARRATADLRELIDGAHRTIGETRAMEVSTGGLQSPEGDIPSGSPLAWIPGRIEKHFRDAGLAGAVTRLNTVLPEPELPGFESTYWTVQIAVESPTAEFRKACLAVAEIEPRDSFIRVLDLEIRNDVNAPSRREMVMNIAVLSRKEDAAR